MRELAGGIGEIENRFVERHVIADGGADAVPILRDGPSPQTVTTLIAAPVSDTVYSADGSRLYAALTGGGVAVYDTASGALLNTIAVGSFLAGIDISPDGRFLLVVEDSGAPGNITGVVHKVDLATGTVTDFTMAFGSVDGPFHDIAMFDNGLAIVTTKIRGSGSTTTYSLNTATGVFSFLTSGSAQAPIVMASADRRHVALTQGFNVSGPNQYYGLAGTGTIRLEGSRGPAAAGQSIAAYSNDGTLFASTDNSSGLRVYDNSPNLNVLMTLAEAIVGVAFDATGDFMYVLDSTNIRKFSTVTWTVVDTISTTGVSVSFGFGYGNGEILTVGPDSAYFLYNNGSTVYRIDNTTAVTPVEGSATGETMNGTAGADVLHGNEGNDTLNGAAGDDILRGGAGNDVLDGGTGHDAMYGGTGDDIYYVEDARDLAVENDSASGTDEVIASLDYALGPNIERLTLVGGAIAGTGNSLANIITGTSGNNILNGMGGADVMIGGAGSDNYWVDDIGDQVVELPGGGLDVVLTTLASYTLGSELENLSFNGSGAFIGTGNALDNAITGGNGADFLFGQAGNDYLSGNSGNDQLDGGTGADYMDGGTGNDIYFVDDLGDFVSEQTGGTNFDEIRTTLPTFTLYQTANSLLVEGLTGLLSTGQTLIGSAFSDRITGGSGADQLYGAGGDDLLVAQVSDSVIDGGSGTDTVNFAASGTVTAVLSGLEGISFTGGAAIAMSAASFVGGFDPASTFSGTGSLTINMGGGDTELYLQSIALGAGAVTLTVNGGPNGDIIKGVFGSVNTINGGDGGDQIRGGSLGDIINGGNGDDKLFGANGADTMTGGAGADTFRFQTVASSGVGAAADQITDFTIGTDVLGFALIDADPVTPGDQAFAFLGTGAFTSPGTGQIRYMNSGADLLVQVDVDGNGTVDMEVVLQGLTGQTLTGASFLL